MIPQTAWVLFLKFILNDSMMRGISPFWIIFGKKSNMNSQLEQQDLKIQQQPPAEVTWKHGGLVREAPAEMVFIQVKDL